MAELTTEVLQKLLECQSSAEVPPRLIRSMAVSLIKRNKTTTPASSRLIPSPPAELRQRCAELLEQRRTGSLPSGALRRLADQRGGDLQSAITETLREALLFIAGETDTISPSSPIKVPRTLLEEAEAVITDALGLGATHSYETHDDALEGLHEALEHSEGSDHLFLPRSLLGLIEKAMGAIVYGRRISQDRRENALTKLRNLINPPPASAQTNEAQE